MLSFAEMYLWFNRLMKPNVTLVKEFFVRIKVGLEAYIKDDYL